MTWRIDTLIYMIIDIDEQILIIKVRNVWSKNCLKSEAESFQSAVCTLYYWQTFVIEKHEQEMEQMRLD